MNSFEGVSTNESIRQLLSTPPNHLKAGTTNDSQSEKIQPRLNATIPSPIQLSSISGLPADCNVDTVSLRDIVGHPLIKECWAFNYLIDVDFLL